MAILDILHYPDKRLRKVAKPVAKVDDRIKKLVTDMFETMYEAPGIGLAATQINVHKQVIVIDVSAAVTDTAISEKMYYARTCVTVISPCSRNAVAPVAFVFSSVHDTSSAVPTVNSVARIVVYLRS